MTPTTTAALRSRYKQVLPQLRSLGNELRDLIIDSLESIEFVDSVQVRIKRKESLVVKVMSDPTRYSPPFKEVEDVIGARILVLFAETAANVSQKIHTGVFPPIETGYRQAADPATFAYEGFQSVHTIPKDILSKYEDGNDFPRVFELQVRTLFQHAALEVEHELYYKNRPSLDEEEMYQYRKRIAWAAANAWGSDRVLSDLRNTMLKARGHRAQVR